MHRRACESLSLINMDDNAYQDINNRWHAPLMNAYNNYCWYITGLQRLQCSSTLANLLSSSTGNITGGSGDAQRLMANMIEPIKIINKLDGSNGKAVVDELRSYFDQHSDVYKSTDGFSTNIYLSKYILPIIYRMNGGDNETTVKIMKEIGMDSSSLYVANEVISDNRIPIMNAAEEQSFRESIYKPFHGGFVKYIQKNPFKANNYASAEIELWSATNSGHVIPLIQKMGGGWVVFDDHRFVGDVKDYLSQPYNFHKVKFSLTDDSFKRYIRGEVNRMSGGARAINDFEVSESLVYLTLTNRKSSQVPTNPLTMAGGAVNAADKNRAMDRLFMIIAWVAIGLTVVLVMIVVAITRRLNRRQEPINVNPYIGVNPYAKTNPYVNTNPYAKVNPYVEVNPYNSNMNPYAEVNPYIDVNPYASSGKINAYL